MKKIKKLHLKKNFIVPAIFFLITLFFFISHNISYPPKSQKKTPVEFQKEVDNFYNYFVKKNGDNFQNKKIIKIKSGDSLQKILLKEKISHKEINKINFLLKNKVDTKSFQVGQNIYLVLNKQVNETIISRLSFSIDKISTIHIFLNESNEYKIKVSKKYLKKKNFLASGVIKNSLYNSAQKIGVDAEIIIEFARIFGFEIDFQRDIRLNDKFQILYERFEDDDGNVQKNGEIIFAYLNNNNNNISLYRFKDQKNRIGYYSSDGKSIEKALMKTPINGARLSSSYGMRKHPILGYNKMHRGTDFAAPKGTPIMASGSGTIERASRNGAYGKYIRIRHNSTYKTAYAHLSKYGRKIKKGARVKQGQIIGYVGSTGRSTGPHLHYEVLINNKRTNPQKLRLPSGKILKGYEKKLFRNTIENIEILRKELIKKKVS